MRPAQAEPLGPADLLLVYNADLPASRELAEYYAQVRAVPKDRLCGLHVTSSDEEIPVDVFERQIRQPIRSYLDEHQLREHVRCLVTFYGLPLRVRDLVLTPADRLQAESARRELSAKLREFDRTIADMERILHAKAGTVSTRTAPPASEIDLPTLLRRYQQAALAAAERLSTASQDVDGNGALIECLRKVEGDMRLLSIARVEPGGEAAASLQFIARKLLEEQVQAEVLLAGKEPAKREEGRRLLQKVRGLSAVIGSLRAEIEMVQTEHTAAAVDSELMLLWWDSYPHSMGLPSPLCWRNFVDRGLHAKTSPRFWTQPVLMTARLDAATAATARRMIDDAIAAEQRTPSGTVYIDSRGIARTPQGFGKFDQNLRDLWRVLKLETKLPVQLDERQQLFGKGECPNTLLYCGWYSLRQYIDAFTFVRGAVAMHIASFEAISLKKPNESGWCRNLLEHGATATLGPVAEPYLESFPLPKQFFGLLLTGKYTLAECFAYTSPWTSWMQILLGDPLYRPFARQPYLRLEQVFASEEIPKSFGGTGASPPTTAPEEEMIAPAPGPEAPTPATTPAQAQ